MESCSTVFARSQSAPSVFVVKHAGEDAVIDWLEEQNVPTAAATGVFRAAEYSWAILDAGVVCYDRYGFGSMPSGYRIIGGTFFG